MATASEEEKAILPHHEQQRLCTTRLPYRQGRKLTAIKVYTVNNESNHLLVFGVPSLNLRQEMKSLFMKFGKLLQFNITTKYPTEQFTETYHAIYEKIQSARIAKRMLDTKNFYGGSLHVCYAPELETIEETRQKLMQRQRDVMFRLVNLNKDSGKEEKVPESIIEEKNVEGSRKLNMGELNTISVKKQLSNVYKNKRKKEVHVVIEKRFKPCFIPSESGSSHGNITSDDSKNKDSNYSDGRNISQDIKKMEATSSRNTEIEIIDCTSVDTETITNIHESLNYKNFGNEIIRKVSEKPVNRIKFNLVNKNL